ncbi:restriction endonuclease fold toxin-2 domain-containing protein [Kribbella sp. DT2]|uniref:restriction endonuclease fold toxin-2 domain-containing protein n=1 Tax=Kribbella sp. DT2 TaxID=3393427 RepID=UPI003CF1888A
MPSDLQRVARGLVECLDEVPQVVQHLQRTADRCRENAALAIVASQGRATVAAQQLDAAARACEAAAHYLSMAPPKAKAWAERLVGEGRSTNRPDSGSADRNKATGGGGGEITERDSRGRTKRLVARFAAEEDPEAVEAPLIQVARKAFEQLRKKQDKDAEEREKEQPEEALEVELVVDPKGELRAAGKAASASDDEDEEREEPAYEIAVDLGDAARELLEAMSAAGEQRWERAELVIAVDRVTASFEYGEEPVVEVVVPVVDVELPEFEAVEEARPGAGDGNGVADDEIGRPADAETDFREYRQRLTEGGRIRPIVGSGPEMEFQRRHCGPIEFRLTTDDRLPRAVWADGLNALLRRAQDAKYVAPESAKSFYRPDSLPPFLRKIAEEKNDHMLMKYREVIESDGNPVEGLEIITNDLTAAAYFRDRMAELDIPGEVTVDQEDGE